MGAAARELPWRRDDRTNIQKYVEDFDLLSQESIEGLWKILGYKNIRTLEDKPFGTIDDILIVERSCLPTYLLIAAKPSLWSSRFRQFCCPISHIVKIHETTVWLKDSREHIKTRMIYNPDYVRLKGQSRFISMKMLYENLIVDLPEEKNFDWSQYDGEYYNPSLWRGMYW